MNRPPLLFEPPFDLAVFVQALRPAFERPTPRFLSLPGALSRATIRALRQLAIPKLRDFQLADRGRFRVADLTGESATSGLVSQLHDFAAGVSGLTPGAARLYFIAFPSGGYSLRLDDARSKPAQRFLELTVDLSSAPGNAPGTLYSEGPRNHQPLEQEPGQLSLIERGPDSSRVDRYRSLLHTPRALVLLRATFPLAES